MFFDTSALVKRYAEEDGTDVVDELIEADDEPIVITSLTVIEMTSAFRRKYNRDEITARERDGLLVAFFEDATDRYSIVPIEAPTFEVAFDLVLQDDLRTLDALQLAAALESAGDIDLRFVCADRKLVTVAENSGLDAVNPSRETDKPG
ncbi:MAG: type II toxin-antitoxin system VapC family toxin [Haloferacaceae archaeon]